MPRRGSEKKREGEWKQRFLCLVPLLTKEGLGEVDCAPANGETHRRKER